MPTLSQKLFSMSKQTSFACLSLLCFCLADVKDGLGPFLGVYLQSMNWRPDEIGFVMTAGGLAELAAAAPFGALADSARHKRGLIAASILIITAACGLVFLSSSAPAAALSKVLSSLAAAAIAPALASLTLGMTGQAGLPLRLGKNEAWGHAGNAATALLGGLIGFLWGIPGVFAVMACMGLIAAAALCGINPAHIDYAAARGLASEPQSQTSAAHAGKLRTLFSDKALLVVGGTLFFFHLGNAAMLPLLGQSAVAQFDADPAAYTAGTVLLAQATMIVTALLGAHAAEKKGYAPLFYAALIALPIRGCIAGFWENPWNLIPVQILDGVGAGLLGVATPGIVARILVGSGRINLGLGFVLTIQGFGAAFSNAYGGLFAQHAGYGSAFLALALAPCAGLLLFEIGKRRLPRLQAALTSASKPSCAS